jgi:hypothetical protein
MRSALECLAEADRLEETARQCADPRAREAILETANEWRRVAMLAREQEAWEALHPVAIERPHKPKSEKRKPERDRS